MLAKYKIDFAVPFNGHQLSQQQQLTNDPVACEELLAEILERGYRIVDIYHAGVALPPVEADRMIKTAAGVLATRHLCASLNIDTAEAHHRFGSPA